MKITTEPQGYTVIEFDQFDGFVFATRPGQIWPVSSLRAHGPDNKTVTIDAEGDLIDHGNIPEDCGADELSAFVNYALWEARSQIDELLTIEERKQAGGAREAVFAAHMRGEHGINKDCGLCENEEADR